MDFSDYFPLTGIEARNRNGSRLFGINKLNGHRTPSTQLGGNDKLQTTELGGYNKLQVI